MISLNDLIVYLFEILIVTISFATLLTFLKEKEEDKWIKEFNKKWRNMSEKEKEQFIKEIKKRFQ